MTRIDLADQGWPTPLRWYEALWLAVRPWRGNR